MAKQVHPREDLVAEATAYADRVELLGPADGFVFIGIRGDGGGSIYFGDDPVVHFNARGEVRRIYAGGTLKADKGRLVRVGKKPDQGRVQLTLEPLSAAEELELLSGLAERLLMLKQRADGSEDGWRWGRHVSADKTPIQVRVRGWLDNLPSSLRIATQPHAGK